MKRRINIRGLIGIMILSMSLVGCGEKKEEVTTTQEVVTEESADTGDTETTTEIITEVTTEEAKVEITVPEDGSIRVKGEVSPDRVKPNYAMDDVAGAIEIFGNGADSKMQMMTWLTSAKCFKQLIDGEVDYCICHNITVDSEDGAETLLLFYVKDEYMNKWMNNWGVNK